MKLRVGILGSTRGTALQGILDATGLEVEIVLILSDRPTAQSEAVALGAIKGFGKSALDSPDTTSLLRSILAAS